jgi:hypothetical protein
MLLCNKPAKPLLGRLDIVWILEGVVYLALANAALFQAIMCMVREKEVLYPLNILHYHGLRTLS